MDEVKANPTNASNPLGPQVCHIRRIVQTGFLDKMMQEYLSEITAYCKGDVWRPQLDIEKELYDNTKDWGNKGYLPEGYVNLASTLQHEAKPVTSMGYYITSAIKATTGASIRLENCRENLEVKERIHRLINEIHADICKFMPVWEENMLIRELVLPCPAENDYITDLENFIHRENNYLARELNRKFPTGSPEFLDALTLLKEDAQREKRLQTYRREDAESDACITELGMTCDN